MIAWQQVRTASNVPQCPHRYFPVRDPLLAPQICNDFALPCMLRWMHVDIDMSLMRVSMYICRSLESESLHNDRCILILPMQHGEKQHVSACCPDEVLNLNATC